VCRTPNAVASSHKWRSRHPGARAQVGAKRRRSETCAGCQQGVAGAHVINGPALDPLRGHAAGRNGRPAAKRLEARVHDVALAVHLRAARARSRRGPQPAAQRPPRAMPARLNLQFHHVAARWRANKAGANRDVGLVEGAYVARVVVVVHHLHAEAADASQRRKKAPAGHVRPRRAA